jgi:hypothetical protein
MEHGTYDFTKDGKCIGCGNCCSAYLPLTDKEITAIRRYIKANNIKECVHTRCAPLAKPTIDLTCPFLDDSKSDKKCTIYPARGKVCKDFICCPSERPPADFEWGMRAKIVNMREVFFGKRGV